MIPKEKIEEVRDRASIVEVVGDFVPLKKKGSSYMGLCPFHSEKTPSFSVSEEKKLFYCFGCHASGDAIAFLMKKEGVEFPDAVRSLASRFGVRIEEARRTGPDPREKFYRANAVAQDYFAGMLESAAGKGAREYLAKRGFPSGSRSVKEFGVGFAPGSWDGLVNRLRKEKVSEDAALRAGVLSRSSRTGRVFDKFRARLTFPITDSRGRVVAFGGRSLDGSDPKYLNSPESPVFKKGEVLYGMRQARRSIMDKGAVIVVEGYFDLLALHEHGFTNTVATMGTALTSAQVRSFKTMVERVYTLFDSDRAGHAASVRALELFLEEGMHGRAVAIPRGKDPDDFLRENGPEAMARAVEEAVPLMEFFLTGLRGSVDMTTPEGKARYLDKALSFIMKVGNVAERDHYAVQAAHSLGIPPESVYEAIKGSTIDRASGERGRRAPGRAARPSRPTGRPASRRAARLRELTVLKVVLAHPELYSEGVGEAVDLFSDEELRMAGKALAAAFKGGQGLKAGALLDEIEDESARATLAGLIMKDDDGFIESPEKMLADSLARILGRNTMKDSTRRMLESLEEAGFDDMAREMRKRVDRTDRA